jgi:hypothetical protein
MVMKYGSKRYDPDYIRDEKGIRKVSRPAEDKAKEDILNWMSKE